jgi:hypothetical protein
MASVCSYQKLKQMGYVTKSQIRGRLLNLNADAQSTVLLGLPRPTAICNGVAFYAPDVAEQVVAGYCPRHSINRMAVAFISGKYDRRVVLAPDL